MGIVFPNTTKKNSESFFFPHSSIKKLKMGKRTRAEKRLAEVTTEYGEQQIAEERKTHAQQATDTDLFYIDSGMYNTRMYN